MVWGLWGVDGLHGGTPADMSGQQDCGGQTAPASLLSPEVRMSCVVGASHGVGPRN